MTSFKNDRAAPFFDFHLCRDFIPSALNDGVFVHLILMKFLIFTFRKKQRSQMHPWTSLVR